MTPWTAAHPASLSTNNCWSLLKLMSIKSVMLSNQLILCCPLLLPSNFSSIRVFSSEADFHTRWPKYWSFSFTISPSNAYSGLINWDDHYMYYCGQESLRRNGVAIVVNKRVQNAISIAFWNWMQFQKWQNDPCSLPRQAIQYHGNPSLCPFQ